MLTFLLNGSTTVDQRSRNHYHDACAGKGIADETAQLTTRKVLEPNKMFGVHALQAQELRHPQEPATCPTIHSAAGCEGRAGILLGWSRLGTWAGKL